MPKLTSELIKFAALHTIVQVLAEHDFEKSPGVDFEAELSDGSTISIAIVHKIQGQTLRRIDFPGVNGK